MCNAFLLTQAPFTIPKAFSYEHKAITRLVTAAHTHAVQACRRTQLTPFHVTRTSSSSVCTRALLLTTHTMQLPHRILHTHARIHIGRCIFKQPLQPLAALEAPLETRHARKPTCMQAGAWCMMGQPVLEHSAAFHCSEL